MKYLALFALFMLSGCATQPTVTSWLDPVSAVTITAQATPLVLARPETRRTVNGRDYVRLAAIEVNRMGQRRLYLIAALWSNANLSGKQWESFESAFSQVEMRIDERVVTLNRHAGDVAELGIGQTPLPLPFPGERQIYYPIQHSDLRAIAESNTVQLAPLGLPGTDVRYEERKDGRASLGAFLNQLPNSSSTAP
jgi:hypothetical protein